MFGFGKKKNKQKEVVLLTLYSDDADNNTIQKFKDKLKTLIGSNVSGAVFGLSPNDRLSVLGFTIDNKDKTIIAVESDDVDKNQIEEMETQFKSYLGDNNVAVFSIQRGESLRVNSIQGE